MRIIDFSPIIENALADFDPSLSIKSIIDISAKVSTNHVYKITFENEEVLIGKLSYFGKYKHFREDHTLINILATKLPAPYENFLAHSLTKNNEVFTYRYMNDLLNAWVVFYRPIVIGYKLPPRLNEGQINNLGTQLALFHKTCFDVKKIMPPSSKTLKSDILDLLQILDTEDGEFEYRLHQDKIREQCEIFLKNTDNQEFSSLDSIPVFVDWNIGNFSVNENNEFFSRWDYDWFRIGPRILDFYFFSRVSSDVGDKTVFSYLIDPLTEDRFIIFLKSYHQTYPLTEQDIYYLKEAYRFFILNYIVKYGRYFFHEIYSVRLQKEAYELYFQMLNKKFNAEKLLKALKI
jgi:hypothetical protein